MKRYKLDVTRLPGTDAWYGEGVVLTAEQERALRRSMGVDATFRLYHRVIALPVKNRRSRTVLVVPAGPEGADIIAPEQLGFEQSWWLLADGSMRTPPQWKRNAGSLLGPTLASAFSAYERALALAASNMRARDRTPLSEILFAIRRC